MINPIVINLNCLYDASELNILAKDVNGLVNLSTSLGANIAQICEKMGYKVKMGGVGMFCGATDAASAARCGLDAISIVAVRMLLTNTGDVDRWNAFFIRSEIDGETILMMLLHIVLVTLDVEIISLVLKTLLGLNRLLRIILLS